MGPPLAPGLGSTVSDSFEITYAAHTATCTFLLDADGICRRVIATPASSARSLRAKNRDTSSLTSRCMGAQYVASLDPSVSGMLAEKPRVGASMLFARVDDRGRISLVRTGAVTRFERYQAEDPFEKSGERENELSSMSVETSAPVIEPSAPTPRFARQTVLPETSDQGARAHGEVEGRSSTAGVERERSQPLHNLQPGAFLRLHAVSTHSDIEVEDLPPSEDNDELARTCEYKSSPTARKTWPSAGDLEPPALPTLRKPSASMTDDDSPYVAPDMRVTTATPAAVPAVRTALPRPSRPTIPPPLPRTKSDRVPRSVEPVTVRQAAVSYPAVSGDNLTLRRR